jgi:hypothetical protein
VIGAKSIPLELGARRPETINAIVKALVHYVEIKEMMPEVKSKIETNCFLPDVIVPPPF